MESTLKTLLFFALSSLSFSATINITDPCSGDIVHSFKILNTKRSVGAITKTTLVQNKIDHIATEDGVVSIYNTPEGLDSMEVISDTQLRRYGWCYMINGTLPDTLAGQTYIQKRDTITWFYGYSLYDRGSWYGYCDKASNIKPKFLCKN